MRPLFVVVALSGAIAPAHAATSAADLAQQILRGLIPSKTGNFVAGVQALKDLRTHEAADYFMSAARINWDDPVLVERAFTALAADGQMKEAASVAKHLLDVDPSNELAKLLLGTQALKDGDYSQTEAILAVASQDSFTAITGSILRAWAFVGDKQTAKADELLDQLSSNGLEDFLVFHRALMAEAEGDTKKAIDLAGKAYDAEPNVARIVEVYSRMLANDDQFDEAQATIDSFEDQGLTHPVVTEVKKAVAEKRHPGAFVTSVQVGAAEMYHGIGVALSRDGSTELSIVFLRMALYLDPNADVISLALGQLLDEAGRQELANEIYDGIPANSVMKPTAVVRIAQNLETLGDRPEALRRLSNIVATNPTDLDALSVLGDMQRYDEQYDAAAQTYTKALALTGGEKNSDWRFYYVRGIAYERAKQWPKAETDFLKALDLYPDQPAVLNYLGYTWIDKDIHLDEALAMIQKAVDASPQDGYVVDSLGWAFYKLGRNPEAVATLEQAVQLMPNDPEINDHLGDAYLKAGRALEARFQWNIASAVDTIGEVKARVAPKLAASAPNDSPVTKAEAITPTPAAPAAEPEVDGEPMAPAPDAMDAAPVAPAAN
ncbi:tetratricopeptide repeat protein [Devosia sp.]|uniref:tetratricopeptide repeat protein n=1 Tax=Devosia sp. TaxID=1871048 RepID=UPI003263CDAE